MRILTSLLHLFIVYGYLTASVLAASESQPASKDKVIQIGTPADQKTVAKAEADSAEQQTSLAFKSLEQVDELTQIGLSGLAMRMIEQQQKIYPEYSPDWYAFEFKYFNTLSSLELWQDIIDRADLLLDKAEPGHQITPKISRWLRSQRAIALLKLGHAEQSLQQTRSLLWEGRGEDKDRTAFWRRLIIRSYLQLDYAADANKALLKYRRDYGDYKSDWKLLQAQALLRADRPAEVIDILAGEKSHKATALRLLAVVRAHPNKAKGSIKNVKKQLDNEGLSQAQQRAYLYVLYEAYVANNDMLSAADTVEQLLALNRTQTVLGEHFSADADDLWQLYERIGEQAGNQYNLLKGDDTAWSKHAGNKKKDEPVRARGMYAVIAFTSGDETRRQLAHKEIVDSLSATDAGLEVVNQLYMQSKRVGSSDNLPVEVRYRLVDYALSIGDIPLAAAMMASLTQPPAGEEYFDWQMRKARVLILEGEYQQGEAELRLSLQTINELSTDMVDRYLQVVFDLQTVNRHKQALELFDLLPIEAMDNKLRREIYYWKAESNYELEQYDQAALLYMQSAKAGDETMMDLWSQSARFKASDALLKAKLYDDAQHAYTELLKITTSDSRKRLIRQKLQHLRLLHGNDAKSASAQVTSALVSSHCCPDTASST